MTLNGKLEHEDQAGQVCRSRKRPITVQLYMSSP